MSEVPFINILLGLGYSLQVIVCTLFLLDLKHMSAERYLQVSTNKSLFVELIFVVILISSTVAIQNLFHISDLVDSVLFVWRVILNFWSITIWLRWLRLANKLKTKVTNYGKP